MQGFAFGVEHAVGLAAAHHAGDSGFARAKIDADAGRGNIDAGRDGDAVGAAAAVGVHAVDADHDRPVNVQQVAYRAEERRCDLFGTGDRHEPAREGGQGLKAFLTGRCGIAGGAVAT